MMEFGLGLFPTEPPRSIVETTKLAEDLGYAHVWMGDSQLIWREVYVNLGAAGLATSRITLGQGVTNPITRHPTVTASALATLSELTDGRVALGIGAGDSSGKETRPHPTSPTTTSRASVPPIHAARNALLPTRARAMSANAVI